MTKTTQGRGVVVVIVVVGSQSKGQHKGKVTCQESHVLKIIKQFVTLSLPLIGREQYWAVKY